MTGLDVARHRVIEICVERVVDGYVVGRIETLVSPFEGSESVEGVPVGNEHVHGITRDALKAAPPFTAVADEVVRLLDGAILVAHAAQWDASFLEMELARAGREIRFAHFLDTLVLAQRAFSFPSHSLDALCTQLGIERGQAHRAGGDVAALRRVFEHAVTALAPVSARDLWEVRIAERRARTAIVEACVAAVEKGLPVQVVYRPARRKPEPMVMVLTEVRADLDPPRVIGYQLPGRGRRDLRSDRILRLDPADPS
jgi:DNA polymerase-3 subunit epsilon